METRVLTGQQLLPTATSECRPDAVLTSSLHLETDSGLSRLWRVSLAALALQLVGMLIFTTLQYDRFNLTTDFATYLQPWVAIAHGNLSPYDTILREPYWRNDFELFLWPLALLYWVYPHGVIMLWAQVLAVIGGELVVVCWARESLTRYGRASQGAWVVGLVTLLLVTTPWSWYTVGFDLHSEVFATPFALLAARALWSGRFRGLFYWVPLTLACCAVAGSLYLIAVGLAGFIARAGSRRIALAIAFIGALWLVIVSSLGGTAFGGHPLSSMYGYLTSNPTGHLGITQIVTGMAEHPSRALHMLLSRTDFIAGYVVSGGILGLRSLWGLIPATFVLLPNVLNADVDFIHFNAAFQSWAAVLFLVAATGLVLGQMVRSNRSSKLPAVLGAATLVPAVWLAVLAAPLIPSYISRVSPAAAAKLAALQREIPANAEVIASQGIVGRFSARAQAYEYWAQGVAERFPIPRDHGLVVFIFAPKEGTAEGLPSETLAAARYVSQQLKARPILQGAGISAYVWSPPSPTSSVRLP